MLIQKEYYFEKFKANLQAALYKKSIQIVEDRCVGIWVSMKSKVFDTYENALESTEFDRKLGTVYLLHGEEIYYSFENEEDFNNFACNKFNAVLSQLDLQVLESIRSLSDLLFQAKSARIDNSEFDFEEESDRHTKLAEIATDV